MCQILIVDDDRCVLKALGRVVHAEDYLAHLVSTPEEALAILKQNPDIRVIISDYFMPVMDGAEFLAQATLINPTAYRIILSSYAYTEQLISCINLGHANKFLIKPWNDDELLQIIRDAISENSPVGKL